jgi:nucleoside triphosphate pyrophosphatase
MTRRFILASGSPRRRELLASLGIKFTVIKPNRDEKRNEGEAPLAYVSRVSYDKAMTVASDMVAPAVVLAADTIVVLSADTIGVTPGGDILGKPADADDARRMLKMLRGQRHTVITAFTLVNIEKQGVKDHSYSISDTVLTTVRMRDYTDAEIDAYVATGDPLDKAGAYAIQNAQFHPVESLAGCYNNVVGLPLCALRWALSEIKWPGIKPPAPPTSCDCPKYTPPTK